MLRQAEGIFRLHYTRVSILIRLLFIPSGKLNPDTASRKTEGNQPKEWPISPDSFFFSINFLHNGKTPGSLLR